MCLPHCILAPRSCKALLGFGLVIYDDCGDYDDDGDDQLQRLDGGRVPRKEQRMEEAFLQRSLVGTTVHQVHKSRRAFLQPSGCCSLCTAYISRKVGGFI